MEAYFYTLYFILYARHTVDMEIATLHTLNLLNFGMSSTFLAEGWVPKSQVQRLRSSLTDAATQASSADADAAAAQRSAA